MNYLAHAYLSGPDDQLLIGNFIADSVRGSQLGIFPARIAQGIVLHRQIDTFTDAHPVVALTKERLRPQYRKYAGVVADVFYDHFLAVNFEDLTGLALREYAGHVYRTIQAQGELLPEKVRHFLPYMVNQNWLVGYAQIEGIRRSLTGMSRRTPFVSNMETAADALTRDYELYQFEFLQFFPDLQQYVKQEIERLVL